MCYHGSTFNGVSDFPRWNIKIGFCAEMIETVIKVESRKVRWRLKDNCSFSYFFLFLFTKSPQVFRTMKKKVTTIIPFAPLIVDDKRQIDNSPPEIIPNLLECFYFLGEIHILCSMNTIRELVMADNSTMRLRVPDSICRSQALTDKESNMSSSPGASEKPG